MGYGRTYQRMQTGGNLMITKEDLCKENRLLVLNEGAKSEYVIYELRGKLSPCYQCDQYMSWEKQHYCHVKKVLE